MVFGAKQAVKHVRRCEFVINDNGILSRQSIGAVTANERDVFKIKLLKNFQLVLQKRLSAIRNQAFRLIFRIRTQAPPFAGTKNKNLNVFHKNFLKKRQTNPNKALSRGAT